MSSEDSSREAWQSNRRQFLKVTAGGVLASSMSMPLLLEACNTTKSGSSGIAAKLPSYIEFAGPTPDVQPNSMGVQSGWFKYPQNLVQSVKTGAPMSGGSFTALVPTVLAVPPAVDQNAYWTELNRRLGGTWNPIMASLGNDYNSKLATTMAGGDLPDALHIPFVSGVLSVPHLSEFLTSSCADLTPFLSGDAVKDYPNLANIPTYVWRTALLAGKLYGLPVARSRFSDTHLFIQQNVLDQIGATMPQSTDDFTKLAKELTTAGSNHWAMTSNTQQLPFGIGFFLQVFGAPNQWKVDSSGKFTKDWETAEAKAAVDYVRQLFALGVFMPGTATESGTQEKADFISGKSTSAFDTWSAYQGYWTRAVSQKVIANEKIVIMDPFPHDGKGKATFFFGTGAFGVAFLKKASDSRIKELLRAANYFAAPFGTEEYLFLKSGIKDVDFTYDANGSPVNTTKGTAENALNWGYVTSPPDVIFNNSVPSTDFTTAAHNKQQELAPLGVANPALGLYSDTQASKGSTLNQNISDRLNDIIAGRADMTAYDQMVSDWKSSGGDDVRKELQTAWQKAQ